MKVVDISFLVSELFHLISTACDYSLGRTCAVLLEQVIH